MHTKLLLSYEVLCAKVVGVTLSEDLVLQES